MNKNQEIWEALGHHFHEWTIMEPSSLYYSKCSCGVRRINDEDLSYNNPDFSSDPGKFLLLREMMNIEDAIDFFNIIGMSDVYDGRTSYNWIRVDYILDKTGKLRDAVWEWLKGEQP
jgi:hypothetical protein